MRKTFIPLLLGASIGHLAVDARTLPLDGLQERQECAPKEKQLSCPRGLDSSCFGRQWVCRISILSSTVGLCAQCEPGGPWSPLRFFTNEELLAFMASNKLPSD